jgi:hypothetical protein
MQNCLNFSVDRSTTAKHATAIHPNPGPRLTPVDTVPAGHKREGENLSRSRQNSPSFKQPMDSRRHVNNGATVSNRTVSPGPLRGAEQRRGAGGFRLALSEPQASLASRPAHRVAQGTGAAGTDPGVAFSLATFFWRSKRKYARASSAGNTAKRNQKTPHPHPGPPLEREGENRCTSRRHCPKPSHRSTPQ